MNPQASLSSIWPSQATAMSRTALNAIGPYPRPNGVALTISLTIAAPQIHAAILRINGEHASGLVVTKRTSGLARLSWPLRTKCELLVSADFRPRVGKKLVIAGFSCDPGKAPSIPQL